MSGQKLSRFELLSAGSWFHLSFADPTSWALHMQLLAFLEDPKYLLDRKARSV